MRIWLAAFAIHANPCFIDVEESRVAAYLEAFAILGKKVDRVEALSA